MMNERIRELAEQARKHFPKTETSGEFWVFDEEKFAELIVKECFDEIEKGVPLAGLARDRVLNHFGVEE
jgi:hypothetical protein